MRLYCAFLFAVFTMTASATDSFTLEGLTYTVTSDSQNTVEITARENSMSETWKNLEIPSIVRHGDKEYRVTSIADDVFYITFKLQTLKVPESVTHIGARAFSYCYELQQVELPPTLTDISDGLFENCTQLTELVLSDSIRTIGNRAFAYCEQLKPFEFTNTVRSVGDCAFLGCLQWTSVTLPATVEKWGSSVFLNCRNLRTVNFEMSSLYQAEDILDAWDHEYDVFNLPASMTYIDVSHLSRFSGLKAVSVDPANPNYATEDGVLYDKTMSQLLWYPKNKQEEVFIVPETVRTIKTLNQNPHLRKIILPDQLQSIAPHAFSDTPIDSITIPASVTEFGDYVFANCTKLKYAILQCPLSALPAGTFAECTSIESFVCPDSITAIGAMCFYNSGLRSFSVPQSVRSIDSWGFARCRNLKQVSMPSQMRSIGGCAFLECEQLEEVTLPDSLQYFGDGAFMQCMKLSNVSISSDNPNFFDVNGVLADRRHERLIYYPTGRTDTLYILPASIKRIGDEAFYKQPYLRTLVMHAEVDSLGAGALHDCPQLRRITGLPAVPPYYDMSTMMMSDFDADVYVPLGSLQAYQQDYMWSMYRLHEVDFLPLGDANSDGNLTVADMAAIAHYVLGHTLEGFSETAADANQDGQVNVADYTAVAHLLLYGSIERPVGCRESRSSNSVLSDNAELENTVYIAPASVTAGEELTLSVKMKNAVDAEGFQFTLTLPDGVSVVRDDEGFAEASLSTERTTKEGTNTFATSLQPDGTLKVMGASTNGTAIKAGDGEVCTVRIKVDADMAEGDYALLLSDVAISDTNAKSYDLEPLEATLTVHEASGISAALNDKGEMINEKCFDLHGRQLSNSKWLNSQMKKGVYIQDGRKYVK
ncbi:MAG: leucine-rich repeat protein [Prevotella sp.]|nr:leucine-rich repeat protein [Prevotella sp.]